LKGAAQSLVVAARRREAAEDLWHRLQISSGRGASLSELDSILADVELVVNSAPLGRSWTPFSLALLGPGHTVVDLVYEPPVTVLVRAARRRGARAVNGLGMLLHRGMASFEIWTGEPAPEPVMRSALERGALEQMSR
jgi:shikimate dehydrogenase